MRRRTFSHARSRLLGAVLALAVLGLPSLSAAQMQDTLGVVDTLRFGSAAVPAGGHVAVPVNVVNDVSLVGLSIPVVYPASVLHADSVSFAHGRISHFAQLVENIDQPRGALLIGAIQFTGDPLFAGAGAVAWIHFTVAADATPGSVAAIDTGYFSDPGMLLFSADAGGTYNYQPAVFPGQITVMEPNTAPEFEAVPDLTIREGDTLRLALAASDAQADAIRFSALNKPPGATFVDHGDGTAQLDWPVPYSGPYAATGAPMTLRFAADDGVDVAQENVSLEVVNVNRPPVLDLADTVMAPALDSLRWDIDAYDPDLEPVTLTVSGLPGEAAVGSGNPLPVRWQPLQADTGHYGITVRADDGHGGETEQAVVLYVEPVPRVEFAIGQVSGYNDQEVLLPISMKNTETIAGFELLFHLDPTAATVLGFERVGTRTEDWEMFATSLNHNGNAGDVQIIARADVADGTPTPDLDAGEGVVVFVRLHLISDASYAGLSFPVRFVFRTANANTATDAYNVLITQDQIAYTHGSVDIILYENVLPGDLNLNGLAFEIGDVVILANYLSDPVKYSLTFEQLANSDANQDGIQATIADLVFMINKLSGGAVFRSAPSAGQTAGWSLSPSGSLALQSQTPLGGAFVTYRDGGVGLPAAGPAAAGLKFMTTRDGSTVRVVIFSMTHQTIDPDAGALVEGMESAHNVSVELSDPDGRLVMSSRTVLPSGPTLLGNFPNPFNPSTAIRFALTTAGDVRIAIYNTLGRRVKLLSGTFEAGEHELTWLGTDESGASVSSGVYFYRLETADRREVRRMLLLK